MANTEGQSSDPNPYLLPGMFEGLLSMITKGGIPTDSYDTDGSDDSESGESSSDGIVGDVAGLMDQQFDSDAEGSVEARSNDPGKGTNILQAVSQDEEDLLYTAKDGEIEISPRFYMNANERSSRGRFICQCASLAGIDVDNHKLRCSIKPMVEKGVTKYSVRFYELEKAVKVDRSQTFEALRPMIKKPRGSWMLYELDTLSESEEDSHTPSTRHYRFQVPALVDYDMVRRWMRDCSECSAHSGASTTSVARLQQARAEGLLRAIHTTSGLICPLPEDVKFAILSYVWGRTRFPETEPPQTVKDATSFAASIGIEWLWVDRLCIRQDEHEKSRLIPLMKDIFALAEVTIVAADGDDAYSGLPGVSLKRKEEEPFKHREWFEGAAVLPAPNSFNSLFDGCIWRTRGWTLQEHIFSRRLLFFFDTEVVFGCAKGTYRESTGMKFTAGGAGSTWAGGGANPPVIEGQLQVRFSSTEATEVPKIEIGEFLRAVRDYTKRQLTFEEDRVDAFSGLILLSMSEGADWPLLLHGHPLRFFESALTWQQENVPDDAMLLRRPSVGRHFAPSWSWASAGTEVYFLEDYHGCLFEYSILDSIDVYGRVNDKFIPGFLRNAAGPRPSILGKTTQSEHMIPRLHLATLVFEAKRRSNGDGTYTPSVSHREKPDVDIGLDGASFALDRRPFRQESSGDKEVYAVVGRGKNVYIMLLGQHPDQVGLYFRKALFPVQLGFLGAFIRHVSLRWEYIMIE